MDKSASIQIERQWFIDSRQGNIKDEYYFEKKLGSGGYGAVYLAKHKKTGTFSRSNKFRGKSCSEGDAEGQDLRL